MANDSQHCQFAAIQNLELSLYCPVVSLLPPIWDDCCNDCCNKTGYGYEMVQTDNRLVLGWIVQILFTVTVIFAVH